jgi:hypothetical protein
MGRTNVIHMVITVSHATIFSLGSLSRGRVLRGRGLTSPFSHVSVFTSGRVPRGRPLTWPSFERLWGWA